MSWTKPMHAVVFADGGGLPGIYTRQQADEIAGVLNERELRCSVERVNRAPSKTQGVDITGAPLPALPSEDEILAYVIEQDGWVTASMVAERFDVRPSRRLGIKACQGNWSGAMNPSLRVAPRLTAMWQSSLIQRRRRPDGRWEYTEARLHPTLRDAVRT